MQMPTNGMQTYSFVIQMNRSERTFANHETCPQEEAKEPFEIFAQHGQNRYPWRAKIGRHAMICLMKHVQN